MTKLILDDDGFTMLGNALLLGYLVKAVGLRNRETSEEERWEDRREYSQRIKMREILDLAGALDRRIVGNIDIPGITKSESFTEWDVRIVELANSDTDIAKLRIKDIDFSPEYLAGYELHSLMAEVDPFELRMPLAVLGPTKLTRLLEIPVMDYFNRRMAYGLGLSPAEAQFIGPDSVILRKKLEKPPNWKMWNSERAQQLRKAEGWHDDMLAKAKRHVLKPVEKEFQGDAKSQNLAELGERLERLGPELTTGIVEVHSGIDDLGTRLCADPIVPAEVTDKLFPDYGAALDHRCYRCGADPGSFLFFVWNQVAWRAVREGWALCIAQDGLKAGCMSWVPPDEFPVLTEDNALALPDDIGLENWPEFNEKAKSALHADHLWFVLVRDAVARFPDAPTVQSNDHGKTDVDPKPRRYNEGFKEFDAPYVKEGLELLRLDFAKSALDAANQLVDKYGEITVDKWKPGCKAIRSLAPGNAATRLQKKISNALKSNPN